jgi:DNA-binding MarR family transcriptional regulator
MILRKQLRLKRQGYYEVHLQLVNALLPVKLTPKEVEVLAAFMSLDGDIGRDRFGTTARKMIKEKLGLSDGGLGNYLKALKEKGFVKDGEVNKLLGADEKEQVYIFKLVNLEP